MLQKSSGNVGGNKVFETIKNYIRGFLNLLSKTEVEKVFNTTVEIAPLMQNKIQYWCNMYSNNAEWLDSDTGVISLRLEQAITREFANIVLNEMTLKISNKKLNEIYEDTTANLNENLQRGLASGAMIIKPLGENKAQFISQNDFIPVEYDTNGRLIKVVFPEVRQISDNLYYIRLEMHSVSSEKGLTIQNRAFKSTDGTTLLQEVSLNNVEDWATLPIIINYPTMTRPAFGYYRNPIDNTIDKSFAGVSIFDSAIELIKRADMQFGRLDWEFESAERAIHVDEACFTSSDSKAIVVNQSKKRLYRKINAQKNNGDLFEEFSPQLRHEGYLSGLNEYKREIEFSVCLSYGDISNPQDVVKTATEIKTAKMRKYNMVTAIQNNLKDCLDDYVYALAFFNALTTSGYTFTCDFKDSVLTDDDVQRKQDMQDVAIGAMQLWEYRMKWYSEDEKTAKAMVANSQPDVIQ